MGRKRAAGTVEVRDSTLSMLMLYAVRYAMGRRSYCVDEVVRAVMANRGAITDADRAVMLRDIADAALAGELGDQCDADRWRRLAAELRDPPRLERAGKEEG